MKSWGEKSESGVCFPRVAKKTKWQLLSNLRHFKRLPQLWIRRHDM